MITLIAAMVLSTAPVISVAPFEVMSADPADADLGLAMQSLVVQELAAVGLSARTENDLDLKDWGKIPGATHVVVGSIMRMAGKLVIFARLIEPPNVVVTSTKLKVWSDRQQFTSAVLKTLKLPVPARPDGYDVTDELARAWGAALRALQTGDPKIAKEKLSALVEKWPTFMPAKAQLAKL